MIELDAAALVLRGWAETRSRVRAVLHTADLDLSIFCAVCGAQPDSVAFSCENGSAFEVFVRGCVAEFGADPTGESAVESVVVFIRRDSLGGPDLKLLVMLESFPSRS